MVDLLATGALAYGGIGVAVALAFVLYGIDRVDTAAQGAYAVRPLLMPGLILLWPLVIARWRALVRQQKDTGP